METMIFVAAVVVTILWLRDRSAKKKMAAHLKLMYRQGRATSADLTLSGIEVTPDLIQTGPMFLPPYPAELLPPDAVPDVPPVPPAEPSAGLPAETSAPVTLSAEMPAEAPAVLPEAPAAEIPPAFAAPEPAPEFAAEAPAPAPERPVLPPLPKPGMTISAISVMLSVGVVLIVVAGLLFVRSAWDSLTGAGRLAMLASGSVLFFGASALSRRLWKLTRTATAFYALGAFFLPISVWAAGFLELLGPGLSGAANPWLLGLSALGFSGCALAAVHIYKHPFWAAAFLTGTAAVYFTAVQGFAELCGDRQTGRGVFLAAAAAYGLVMAWGSRPLKHKLPVLFRPVLEPFALAVLGVSAFFMLFALDAPHSWTPYAPGFFLVALGCLAPAVSERLKGWTAVPTMAYLLLGFDFLCKQMYRAEPELAVLQFSGTAYFAFVLLLTGCAVTVLLLSRLLSPAVQRGFRSVLLSLVGVPALLAPAAIQENCNLLTAALAVVLLLLLAVPAWRARGKGICAAAGLQCWSAMLYVLGLAAAMADLRDDRFLLLTAGTSMVLLAGLTVTKRLRTTISDLLFPGTAAVYALIALTEQPCLHAVQNDNGLIEIPGITLAGELLAYGILFAAVLIYWVLALAHDTERRSQYLFAFLSPAVLFCTLQVTIAEVVYREYIPWLLLCWSVLSVGLALAAWLTAKEQIRGVRRMLFALTALPPLLAALCYSRDWDGDLLPLTLGRLFCTAAATAFWLLFARRGCRKLAAGGFSAALVLLLCTTLRGVRDGLLDGELTFSCLLACAFWVAALSIFSIVIAHRMVFFVGCDTVPAVMQLAAPISALVLGIYAAALPLDGWHPFYFVCALALSILAWLTTRREDIVLPCLACGGMLCAMESLRGHCCDPFGGVSNGAVFVTLLCFAAMTVLFPYTGMVLREGEDDPAARRRSYSLTYTGGAVPVWLACAVQMLGHTIYSREQARWMAFFVPVLLSGYVLHFAFTAQSPRNKQHSQTAAAALCMTAFWLQPLVDVSDTWLEGKLHLVPLIAFGAFLRHLYGRETGGRYFFGIGCYTMARLGLSAMESELPADLVLVLFAGLFVFIVSFYIKEKKWFLLGGISLLASAFYLHTRLFDGWQWWTYLLLAGLILIGVAGTNEMMKQKGGSLKERAGRFWDDWKW